MDYYEILGVNKDATEKDIKSAFRKKAAEFHPDRNKAADAATNFKKVNEAYQILSDPQKRRTYDQFGSSAFQGGGGGSYGGGQGGFEFDFSEVFGGGFDQIFGGDNVFSDLFNGGRRKSSSQKGEDIFLQLKVELPDIVFGTEKEIKFNRKEACKTCEGKGGSKVETCKTCSGSGRIRQVTRSIFGNMEVMRECAECHGTGKKILEKCNVCRGDSWVNSNANLKIKIPKGIESGVSLRFQSEGNAGKFNTPKGDLFVQIDVARNAELQRNGDNLIYSTSLPIYSLILGDQISVKTLDGERLVNIPKGTEIGERLVVRGLGVPNFRSQKRGDLILEIKIEIPKKLSKEEEAHFESLRELDKKNKKKFWKI